MSCSVDKVHGSRTERLGLGHSWERCAVAREPSITPGSLWPPVELWFSLWYLSYNGHGS